MNIQALRQLIGSPNVGTQTLHITGDVDITDKAQAELDIKDIQKCNDNLRERIYINTTLLRLKNLANMDIEEKLTDKMEQDTARMKMLLDIGEKLAYKLKQGIK